MRPGAVLSEISCAKIHTYEDSCEHTRERIGHNELRSKSMRSSSELLSVSSFYIWGKIALGVFNTCETLWGVTRNLQTLLFTWGTVQAGDQHLMESCQAGWYGDLGKQDEQDREFSLKTFHRCVITGTRTCWSTIEVQREQRGHSSSFWCSFKLNCYQS